MPLGVRDVLLVIRAKDQASRAIGDVGRSFGNLGRKQQAILRDSQKSILQFNRQAAAIKGRVTDATRAQINDINTRLRQNSSISAQLATRNARLRQDYMLTTGAAKRAILDEMLANDVRRKELAEVNSAYQRQALAIRQASDQTLRKELGNIRTLKDAEMDLRRTRMAKIQERQNRGISRMQRGQAIGGVGVGATATGVAGLAFFANAAKHAMTYRDEAAKTFTQVDERLGASVEKLEQMGVRVARNVPIPFKQMQETLYEIFSSMEIDNLPQAEKLLAAIGKAAVAGATDMKTAGSATIGILNAFKVPAKDVTKVLDAQFAGVKEGRLEYEELANTIGRAIPSAAKAGQSYQDLIALMAFLTRNSMSAAMSATSAARAFDLLSNTKFRNAAKGLVDVVTKGPDGVERFRPFVDIMADLKASFDGLDPAARSKKMSEFLGSVSDPKALKALEDMGIQIKNVADPKVAAQIKNNTLKSSNLSLQAAKLRASKTGASKEQKKAIDAQLRQIALQKAQISNASAHMRANTKTANSMRPLADIMADFEEKLKSVSEPERAEIMQALTKGSGGTIQAMRAVNLSLGDTEGLLRTITKEVRNSDGATKRAYGIMAKTPRAKIQAMKNEWETFRQELGVRVIPIMLSLAEKVQKVIEWFSKLDDSTKKNIVKWGLIAGAVIAFIGVLTILSGVVLVIGGAMAMLGLGVGGLALIIGGVIAAGWLLIENWDLISEAAYKLWKNIDDWLITGFQFLVDKILAAAEWIVRGLAKALGWVPGLGGKLKNAAKDIEKFRDDYNRTMDGLKDKEVNIDVVARYKQTTDFPEFIGPRIPKGANFVGPLKPGESREDPVVKRRRNNRFGGFRQHGGLVTAGKTYLVGERRAELFTPTQNGRIIPRVPNTKSTGGNTYYKTVTVNARTTASSQEIADEVSWKLRYQ